MISIALLGLLTITTGQAAKPKAPANFTGTWTLVSMDIRPKPEGTGGSAGLPPSDQVIKQTASTVEISETAFGQVRTRTYSFDGAPNTNKSGATTAVTHSKWVGNKFVTEGKLSQVTSAGYDEWTIKETRWLTPAGVMMIEYESVGLDGSKRSSTRTMKRKP